MARGEAAPAVPIVPAMCLFSSTREQRLWLWTLAVVAAIATSLWVGGQLAEALRDLDALEEALSVSLFLLGMLLVGTTAFLQGVWARPGRLEIAVAAGIAAVYLLVFLRIAILEERSHLIEYGVLGVFVYAALTERASQGRRVPAPPIVAILATSALGLLDECLQLVVPSTAQEVPLIKMQQLRCCHRGSPLHPMLSVFALG